MKIFQTWLLGWLLVCSAYADGTVTTTNIDFAGTYQGDMSNLLTRVEKKVDVRYNYVLSSADNYAQFPDMAFEFELEFGQYIYVQYHVALQTGCQSHFITRVIIDGVEDVTFRWISGHDWYHTHAVTRELWLGPGKHTIKVQYRTPCGYSMGVGGSWPVAILIARYFKK